ncbi:MAG: pyridoxamine 5'-phosphate oxidase family protein [Dehalococcoidia bacterium]|nr:pyridoxamine 5'-phosphate oxidase family protein [Dehalococcoidia bacterium]
MAIELTQEMRERMDNALAEGNPMLVATASAAGMPDLVYKGSLMVFDNEHLAWWERALGTTLRNLRENPQVCVLYRNPASRMAWKIFGVAELHENGTTRDEVMNRTIQLELDKDPERKGVGVVIRVDRVLELGKEIMRRE